jgi:hypothetical protein
VPRAVRAAGMRRAARWRPPTDDWWDIDDADPKDPGPPKKEEEDAPAEEPSPAAKRGAI